jgi:hypothetical protein
VLQVRACRVRIVPAGVEEEEEEEEEEAIVVRK